MQSLKSTKPTTVPKEGRTLIQKEGKIRLTDCRMLGDMFANIHQLMLPCQSMSLLASPHIFYLVMLNPNATEMKERLSFTLYHTLHNEFFAHSSTKGKKSFKAVKNNNSFNKYLCIRFEFWPQTTKNARYLFDQKKFTIIIF